MPQSSTVCPSGGDVSEKFDGRRVARWRFGKGSLDTVNHRREGDITDECVARTALHGADGRADLFVLIRRNIFHQEIHDTRIALQDAQNLQSAVRRLEDRRWGCGRFWGLCRFRRQSKLRNQLRAQRAAEEKRKETTES